MSFFSLDSKFSQIMGRVFDLMMLNIIFLIMCIRIVTIGANFTAMYYVTLKMIKNEEIPAFFLRVCHAHSRPPQRLRSRGCLRSG